MEKVEIEKENQRAETWRKWKLRKRTRELRHGESGNWKVEIEEENQN